LDWCKLEAVEKPVGNSRQGWWPFCPAQQRGLGVFSRGAELWDIACVSLLCCCGCSQSDAGICGILRPTCGGLGAEGCLFLGQQLPQHLSQTPVPLSIPSFSVQLCSCRGASPLHPSSAPRAAEPGPLVQTHEQHLLFLS